MATMAVAFPVLPGKADEARRFAEEAMGPRRGEAAESFRRLGVTHESWYLQSTPMGDMIIVWMDAAVPSNRASAASDVASSCAPAKPEFKPGAPPASIGGRPRL